MPSPQFTERTRWVTCPECQGRSFSDPTKLYHYPECSRYRGWRFPQTVQPWVFPPVGSLCSHREDGDWTACATCTDAADFDRGEDE